MDVGSDLRGVKRGLREETCLGFAFGGPEAVNKGIGYYGYVFRLRRHG